MSQPIGPIERALDSPDPEIRRRAVSHIAELGTPQAVDLVIRALGDEDWRVRKEASQVALVLGPGQPLLDRLVAVFQPGDNVGLRNAAVETLAAFGGRAVRAVVAALPSLDADGRKLATEVLGRAQDASAVPVLDGLSYDPDPNVRMGAVEGIGNLGDLAIDAASSILLRVLSGRVLQERLAALDGLNRLGVVVPWEHLAPLTGDPILRRSVLAAAPRSGSAEAAAVLTDALEDDNASVFRLALVGLADLVLGDDADGREFRQHELSLGPRGRARLLEALAPASSDLDVRAAVLVVAALFQEPAGIDVAIDALVDDRLAREADAALDIYGSQALSRLLARVAHGDAPLRAAAIARLAALRDNRAEAAVRLALRATISDGSPEVACAALGVLSELGGADDIAPVLALVAARTPGVLPSAQSALAALGRRYPEEARASAQAVEQDESSKLAIATLIGALHEGVLGRTEDDVAFLAATLSSPDPETRKTAVTALGQVRSALGTDAVQFALADEERDVQLSAVRALGRLRTEDGQPTGLDRLIELVREWSDPELIAAAARALGDCGGERAQAAIAPLCRASDPVVAVAAIEALGKFPNASNIVPLLEAVSHPHVEVIKAALLAFGGAYDPQICACLGRVLCHSEWDVRRLAADCLGRFGGEAAASLLRERLGCEQEPLVKEAIGRALNVIESPSTVRRTLTIAPPKADP
jgi:HEAT repeat protein